MIDINEKIKGLYFFQFSEGSYSDYRVGGLYACDHLVTEKEWCDHVADYYSKKVFSEDRDYEKTFIKKHNMVYVEYEEFHG